MAEFVQSDFESLVGWDDHDHEAAFAAFLHAASAMTRRPPTERPGSARTQDLLRVANRALAHGETISRAQAKAFFESHFVPFSYSESGLLTGYFEPEFEGSRQRSPSYPFPLHKRPADLVPLSSEEAQNAGFTTETSFARKTNDGLSFHFSRSEVMAGALDNQGLELVWLKDAFDAYIIHIQGSGRIRLDDGSTIRISFDGKSGHPYQSLGKLLIKRGFFTPESITMDALIAWLKDQGEVGLSLLGENPSYIFFREAQAGSLAPDGRPNFGPIAAAGAPLLPLRSIAVDRHVHTFGLPFWLETTLPDAEHGESFFRQLVIAQDTGSAIKGVARADLFVGTGAAAGTLAGQLQQETRFTVLMPGTGQANREVGCA